MQLPQLLQAAVPRVADYENYVWMKLLSWPPPASCCRNSATAAASCCLQADSCPCHCSLAATGPDLYIFFIVFFHIWLWCPLAVFSQRNKKDKKPNIRLYVLTYCINVYVCCFFVNSNNRIPRLSVASCRRWIGRLKGQYHEIMEIVNMGLL